MGIIKTALEIALEKTANVSSDKSSIASFNAEQTGKKIANMYLDAEIDLSAELKKAEAEFRAEFGSGYEKHLKQGVFNVFLSKIALPASVEALGKFDKLGKGFNVLINKKEFNSFFNRMIQIFNQFLEEAAQYEQMIRQQYAPKLRRKEEELSKRLGREIHINPMEDQEFAAVLSQHINALKSNYEYIVEEARDEINKMFSGEK